LFEYYGSPEAERVVVLMGSGVDTAKEVVDRLVGEGAKVGLLQVRLYRPFDSRRFLDCLPKTTKAIAVLDRTKEPGGIGEPLYTDVVLALGRLESPPRVIAGRYGLSSKEFTPAMVKAVYDELARPEPKTTFTIGIEDDVTRLSLEFDPGFTTEPPDTFRAVFYGLGADGTVGANKNTIKIIGEDPRFFAQGYFVYDSKKSGSRTVSHVRFGKQPIRSAYLIQDAHFVACHQFGFVHKFDVLALAAPGATFLLNSPHPPEAVWDQLPRSMQEQMIAKHLRFFVIDANKVAKETNMGSLTNTIMQTCFFGISGVLPREEAIEKIKHSIEKTYGRKGRDVVLRNWRAVDHTLAHLVEVPVPDVATSTTERAPTVAPDAPEPIRKFVARLMAGEGDLLPVSAMPIDGTFPSATSRWEKRNIAESIPIWDPETCVQCGNCGFVCPHSAIRAKLFHISELDRASVTIPSAPIDARGFPETRFLLQVYAEDCTGCGLCVQACPAKNPVDGRRKAINMASKDAGLDAAHESMAFFESLPVNDRAAVDFSTVRGVQFLEPTFEFSGACAGCGETPYLKLLSQLFGDRMIVANATGCSSIYGGNLPTTPWATNAEGRGPAWANSLFEDNAEFGLGMRLAADRHLSEAQSILLEMEEELGSDLVQDLIRQPQILESDVRKQRARVAALIERLRPMDTPRSRRLLSIADHLTRRSVWIVGGDGWAYDIWLGLRYRCSRPRPRPRLGPQCQHSGPRYRGVFEHGRPGVEGDPSGGGRQVRDRRQTGRQEGPCPSGYLLRQRLRGAHRDGREPATDAPGAPRSRRLSGNVADHRVQPLHRARHRHGAGPDPAAARRPLGLLAAPALQPAPAGARRSCGSTAPRRSCSTHPERRATSQITRRTNCATECSARPTRNRRTP